MNIRARDRRWPAVILATVLLMVLAVIGLSQTSVAARHDGAASSDAAGQAGRPPAADPPGAGAADAAQNAPGQGGGTTLAQAAGREPTAQDRARVPEHASGLARVAGQDPGDRTPGQAKRSGPTDRTEGLTERRKVDPKEVLRGPVAPGGCLAEYGEDGQCLPTVPPSMAKHVADMKKAGMDPDGMDHHWGCAEVRTHFPEGITVRTAGDDPQGLDANGDGLACGPGD